MMPDKNDASDNAVDDIVDAAADGVVSTQNSGKTSDKFNGETVDQNSNESAEPAAFQSGGCPMRLIKLSLLWLRPSRPRAMTH